jgi:hypothetical protein
MLILNRVLFLKSNILYVCVGSNTSAMFQCSYLSFVTHLPGDGHMVGQNKEKVYGVYACVHLLVLL